MWRMRSIIGAASWRPLILILIPTGDHRNEVLLSAPTSEDDMLQQISGLATAMDESDVAHQLCWHALLCVCWWRKGSTTLASPQFVSNLRRFPSQTGNPIFVFPAFPATKFDPSTLTPGHVIIRALRARDANALIMRPDYPQHFSCYYNAHPKLYTGYYNKKQ
jgi:hypothetical protein